MKISEAFASKYMKADDIEEDEIRLVIRAVSMEEFESKKGKEQKPIIFFQGEEKGMILNKTNAEIIAQAYGDETEKWIGYEVLLYSAMVAFEGKMVPSIRIRIPKRKPAGNNTATGNRSTITTGRRPAAEPSYEDDDAIAGLEPRG